MMKKIGLNLVIMAAMTLGASAQTVYDGAGRIDQAGNWSAGIPDTAGNPGVINTADGGAGGFRTGTYFITQNDGDLLNTFGSSTLSAGEWTMEDGTLTTAGFVLQNSQIFVQNGGTMDGSDFTVRSGASYTLNNGTVTLSDDVNFAGGSFTMTGGSVTVTDQFNALTGGTFTMSGGTLNVATFGTTAGFSDGGQIFNLNGGTINVTGDFGLFGDTTDNQVIFGGSTAGSLSAAGLVGSSSQYTMDWLSGSLMSLTLTGADQAFYEGLYTSGNILFNGSNAAAFADNFQVSGATLSLVPEPSTFALLGLGLGALFVLRRRTGR